MRLRAATLADAPAVVALEARLFGPDAWSEPLVLSELGGAEREFLVAVEDDEVVGYAVTVRASDAADLLRIGVRPDRQRRRVARTLLEEVLERVRAGGADRVLLEVSTANPAALGFYAAADFVEIDRRRRYYPDGSDAVVMRRSLGRGSCGGRG